MYKVYSDDLLIYDDRDVIENLRAIDPKLVMEENSAGSLTITLPPGNVGYDKIVKMVSKITVHKNDKEIWEGRVIDETVDFWKCKTLVCEGELAYLNDTTQPQAEYHALTIRQFLQTLLNNHNARMKSDDMKFYVGVVTVQDENDSIYRYTNYEKTIECINEKLIERFGGHLKVYKGADGKRYIDYLKDYNDGTVQSIEFGKNLLDYTSEIDMTEFATVIVPLGARLDDDSQYYPSGGVPEALEAYLTVENAPGHDGTRYVKSADAVEAYGWIEKVVKWNDVEEPKNLLSKAKKYLSDLQFENVQLSLKAVDLSLIDPSINVDYIQLYDRVEVISRPHGMDRAFPVTKMEIPLNQPENMTFSLGETVKTSLTAVNNSTNSKILTQIANIPSKSNILKDALENSKNLIENSHNGVVFTETNPETGQTEAIYILTTGSYPLPLQEGGSGQSYWKWSAGGLGFKTAEDKYNVAITNDGHISADFITVGHLLGDIIRGGQISVGGNAADPLGKFVVYAADGKTERIVLDHNGITMSNDTTISWNNLANKPQIVTDPKTAVTTIANTWIKTVSVYAQYLQAGSVNADDINAGTITGCSLVSRNSSTGATLTISDGGITAGSGTIDWYWTGDQGNMLCINAPKIAITGALYVKPNSGKDNPNKTLGESFTFVNDVDIDGNGNVDIDEDTLKFSNGCLVDHKK